MQILYLLPPALILWISFGDGVASLLIVVPILVMASGQLAGGLSWLVVSGEDAPDLACCPHSGPGLQADLWHRWSRGADPCRAVAIREGWRDPG